MARVIALIDDLFFQAKLSETAKQLGVDLRTCTTGDALLAEISRQEPGLVVIDLNARNNPLDAIARVRAAARSVPLIAFLSHVQTELAQGAREAGCSDVMPRSKFTRELPAILASVKTETA